MVDHSALPDCDLLTPLKGGRPYVHSTDLMSALEAEARRLLGPESWVSQLTIRRQATSLVVASFTPHAGAFGSFKLRGPGADLKGWLVASGRPILQRVPFEERRVADRVLIIGEDAILSEPVDGFTRFEQAVLIMKTLAQHQVPGPWVLSQVDLDRPLPESGRLESRFTRTIQDRLKFGELRQDGLRLGTVRCILDTPSGQ